MFKPTLKQTVDHYAMVEEEKFIWRAHHKFYQLLCELLEHKLIRMKCVNVLINIIVWHVHLVKNFVIKGHSTMHMKEGNWLVASRYEWP